MRSRARARRTGRRTRAGSRATVRRFGRSTYGDVKFIRGSTRCRSRSMSHAQHGDRARRWASARRAASTASSSCRRRCRRAARSSCRARTSNEMPLDGLDARRKRLRRSRDDDGGVAHGPYRSRSTVSTAIVCPAVLRQLADDGRAADRALRALSLPYSSASLKSYLSKNASNCSAPSVPTRGELVASPRRIRAGSRRAAAAPGRRRRARRPPDRRRCDRRSNG